MEGEESIIVLLFCGVDDEVKDVLGGSLLHAACIAALRSGNLKQYLLVAQPLPAEGGKGVQLQVSHISRCPSVHHGKHAWTSSMGSRQHRVSLYALQVVYRPGPFDLRAFSQACSKLKASSEYSDGDFSNEIGESSHSVYGQLYILN